MFGKLVVFEKKYLSTCFEPNRVVCKYKSISANNSPVEKVYAINIYTLSNKVKKTIFVIVAIITVVLLVIVGFIRYIGWTIFRGSQPGVLAPLEGARRLFIFV